MSDNPDICYKFCRAVCDGSLERVTELINSFGLPHSKAYDLLCCALRKRDLAVAKLLLTNGAIVNRIIKKPCDTPLHFAVNNGDLEIIKMILTRGADINSKNKYGRTPLCNAIIDGARIDQFEVVELLLEYSADVNAKDNDGVSPLHVAVINGDLEIIKIILGRGADSNSKSKCGRTPLYNAIIEGARIQVVQLLLKYSADVNAKDNDGVSPLHVAVINGDLEIIKIILGRGADINSKNKCGRTPLYNAIIEGARIQVVQLLLKYSADVNAKDNDGVSPLHVATDLGCFQIIKHLIKYGANVNCVCTLKWQERDADNIFDDIVDKEDHSITPLHIAVRKGYIRIAEELLDHGALILSLTSKMFYTPLHFACKQGNEEIVKLLLNRGADSNAVTNDNLTPLHIATRRGHKGLVKLLLQYGAKVDNQDKDGRTALYFAVKKGHPTIVEDILRCGPDTNIPRNKICLEIAIRAGHKESKRIVEALLDYGFIYNQEDANVSCLLYHATLIGCLRIVEDLLKRGANVNELYKQGIINSTLLHIAARYEQEEMVELLISYGADINAKNEVGETPIFYAISNANLVITKLLLKNKAKVKDNPDLLCIAVKSRSLEIIDLLLKHEADINASDKDGRTALHFVAKASFFDSKDFDMKNKIAQFLLEKGANVDAQDVGGTTPLFYAIDNGFEKIVEVVLEYKANVNINLKKCISSLHCSNIDARYRGLTALHIATLKNKIQVVKQLLESGAPVDSGIDDPTPTNITAKEGYQDIIETLLKYDADIDARDYQGRTALYIASQRGYVQLVISLLEFGADINATCKDYYLPFNDDVKNVLNCHIVKMKIANLYVSENCLKLISWGHEMEDFQDKCEEEIAIMKSEGKINNQHISLFNILTETTNTIVKYLRNEDILQVLKSGDHKTKYPLYGSMIESQFIKGMKRKALVEQANSFFEFKLPYVCTEKIINFLTNKDLKSLIESRVLP